jgi:sugar phosphate isomerase/epimerase
MKDVVLAFVPDGVQRQPRPCGQGLIDFDAIVPLLQQHRPNLNLSIENPTVRSLETFEFFNPAWHASHADLTTAELAEFVGLINACQRSFARGDRPDLAAYHKQPFGYAEAVGYITDSAAHLRQVLERHALSNELP